MGPAIAFLSGLFILTGAALIAIGILTTEALSDTPGGTNAYILMSFLGISTDFQQIALLTNNSNSAFCTADIHNFFVYNFTNYDAVRNGSTVVSEFEEIGYNYTRSKCVFDMSVSPASRSLNAAFYSVDPSKENHSIPDAEFEKAAVGNVYYGPWELASAEADRAAPLTLLNWKYIVFSQFPSISGNTLYDDPDHETFITQALVGSVLANMSDTELQARMNAVNASDDLSLKKLKFMISGVDPDIGDIREGYGQYGSLMDAMAVWWFQFDMMFIDDEYYGDYYFGYVEDAWLVNRSEAKAANAVVSDVVANEAYSLALQLIQEGSGPVITRTIDEFHHSGSDPLFEVINDHIGIVAPTEHGHIGSLSTFALPDGVHPDRSAPAVFYELFPDITVDDIGGWYTVRVPNFIDNGTDLVSDDGIYEVNFGVFANPLPLTANITETQLRPPGWLDSSGKEYKASVADAVDGAMDLFVDPDLYHMLNPYPMKFHKTHQYDRIDIAEFRVEDGFWDIVNPDFRQYEAGMVQYGGLRGAFKASHARRDFEGVEAFANVEVSSVDANTAAFKIFFEPETGHLVGKEFIPAHIVQTLPYLHFPNHYLPRGHYPFYAGDTFYDDRNNGGPCIGSRHNIQVLSTTRCDVLTTTFEAIDLVGGTMILGIALGALLIIVAFFLVVGP